MRHVLFAALLGGCITPGGQKVTMLVTERTVTCTPQGEGEPDVAVLQLEQPGDFFKAEFEEIATGDVHALGGIRRGTTVTFTCPAGITTFPVQVAIILQAVREDDLVGGNGGNGGGNNGGSGAPAPTAR